MAIVLTDDKYYIEIAERIRTENGLLQERPISKEEFPLKPSEMSLGISGVVHEASVKGYNAGLNDGYTGGYNNGYSRGKIDGDLEGYERGYASGKNDGKQEEYDTFWDNFQDNGNRGSYACAFGGMGWTEKTFNPKYPIAPKGTSVMDHMFSYFNRISSGTNAADLFDFSKVQHLFDFSGCTRPANAFSNARIKNLYCDFSNATALSSTFASGNGGMINNVTLKVSEKATSYSSTFNYQTNMTDLYFTEDSVIAGNLSHPSTKLSKASITSIINALSTTTSGKTLTITEAAVNKAFETSEGANDGSTSAEWNFAQDLRENWIIALS